VSVVVTLLSWPCIAFILVINARMSSATRSAFLHSNKNKTTTQLSLAYHQTRTDMIRSMHVYCLMLLAWPHCRRFFINNNNNNNQNDVYGAVVNMSHCKSLPGSFDEHILSTRWMPTVRPSSKLGL